MQKWTNAHTYKHPQEHTYKQKNMYVNTHMEHMYSQTQTYTIT